MSADLHLRISSIHPVCSSLFLCSTSLLPGHGFRSGALDGLFQEVSFPPPLDDSEDTRAGAKSVQSRLSERPWCSFSEAESSAALGGVEAYTSLRGTSVKVFRCFTYNGSHGAGVSHRFVLETDKHRHNGKSVRTWRVGWANETAHSNTHLGFRQAFTFGPCVVLGGRLFSALSRNSHVTWEAPKNTPVVPFSHRRILNIHLYSFFRFYAPQEPPGATREGTVPLTATSGSAGKTQECEPHSEHAYLPKGFTVSKYLMRPLRFPSRGPRRVS